MPDHDDAGDVPAMYRNYEVVPGTRLTRFYDDGEPNDDLVHLVTQVFETKMILACEQLWRSWGPPFVNAAGPPTCLLCVGWGYHDLLESAP